MQSYREREDLSFVFFGDLICENESYLLLQTNTIYECEKSLFLYKLRTFTCEQFIRPAPKKKGAAIEVLKWKLQGQGSYISVCYRLKINLL